MQGEAPVLRRAASSFWKAVKTGPSGTVVRDESDAWERAHASSRKGSRGRRASTRVKGEERPGGRREGGGEEGAGGGVEREDMMRCVARLKASAGEGGKAVRVKEETSGIGREGGGGGRREEGKDEGMEGWRKGEREKGREGGKEKAEREVGKEGRRDGWLTFSQVVAEHAQVSKQIVCRCEQIVCRCVALRNLRT